MPHRVQRTLDLKISCKGISCLPPLTLHGAVTTERDPTGTCSIKRLAAPLQQSVK